MGKFVMKKRKCTTEDDEQTPICGIAKDEEYILYNVVTRSCVRTKMGLFDTKWTLVGSPSGEWVLLARPFIGYEGFSEICAYNVFTHFKLELPPIPWVDFHSNFTHGFVVGNSCDYAMAVVVIHLHKQPDEITIYKHVAGNGFWMSRWKGKCGIQDVPLYGKVKMGNHYFWINKKERLVYSLSKWNSSCSKIKRRSHRLCYVLYRVHMASLVVRESNQGKSLMLITLPIDLGGYLHIYDLAMDRGKGIDFDYDHDMRFSSLIAKRVYRMEGDTICTTYNGCGFCGFFPTCVPNSVYISSFPTHDIVRFDFDEEVGEGALKEELKECLDLVANRFCACKTGWFRKYGLCE